MVKRVLLKNLLLLLVFLTFSLLASDELKYTYNTESEDNTSYTGKIAIENPNTAYTWNGSFFAVRDIRFQTSSQVTGVTSDNGAVPYWQNGQNVGVNLGWQSLIDLGGKVNLTVNATKQGQQVYPENFWTNYVRGRDIRYPGYGGLPDTWYKGKTDLNSADLINNLSTYYDTSAQPVAGMFIMYEPLNTTQIQIGQVDSVPYPVNTVNGVRIWIPTRLMVMGIGVVYELFKINPNYMCALGTKENYAAGVVGPDVGNTSNPVVIDGETWYWPIIAHPDGPYQQETGNFNDAKSFYPDFYPTDAAHDDYTKITVDFNDHNWISSAISSGISITVTREFLNAINYGYNNFIDSAVDPWAEFSIITYAYNRGVNDFLSKKMFSDNRETALASSDIAEDFGMGGFANHVPTVRAITDAMNKALYDIYDAQITWQDMEIFFPKLRMFYGRGIPSDTEWNAMKEDVQRAFNVLASHWGGNTVSFRYDYLTLLRVIKEYLPKPYNPRPTGQDWYYQVTNNSSTGITNDATGDNIVKPELKIYPYNANNFNIYFELSNHDAIVDLGIYNSLGRLVKDFKVQKNHSSTVHIVWDGRDNYGNRLPNGIYFVRLEVKPEGKSNRFLQVGKVIISQ